MTESMLTRRTLVQSFAGVAASAALPTRGIAQDRSPIKIGFSVALTGSLAGGGKSALVARQIWRDDVNAKGGIMGRPVELVYYDDQTNAANTPGLYSKLIHVDKVDVLFGPYGAIVQQPVMPLVRQLGRLIFANFAFGVNDQLKYDRFFDIAPWGDGVEQYSGAFVKLAHKQGATTLAIVSADTEATQQLAIGAREIALKLGMKVVYDQKYPFNSVDFSSIIRAVQSTKPEAVLVVSLPNESAAIVRSVNELGAGPSVKLFGGAMIGLQFAPLLESLGSQLNGFVTFHTYVPEPSLDAPGLQVFLDIYAKRARDAQVDALGFYLAPFNYAMGQVIQQAIEATKTTDNKLLSEHIHRAEFATVAGPIRFAGTGQWANPRMVQVQFQGIADKNIEQFRKSGKQVIVWPPELATGALRVPFETART